MAVEGAKAVKIIQGESFEKKEKISRDSIEIPRGKNIKRRKGMTRGKRKMTRKKEKMIKREEKILWEEDGEEIIFSLKGKNIGRAGKRDISVQNVLKKRETRFS